MRLIVEICEILSAFILCSVAFWMGWRRHEQYQDRRVIQLLKKWNGR